MEEAEAHPKRYQSWEVTDEALTGYIGSGLGAPGFGVWGSGFRAYRVIGNNYIRLIEGLGIRLMDKILHYFKYPKLWELWYIPYYGSCRILSISRRDLGAGDEPAVVLGLRSCRV